MNNFFDDVLILVPAFNESKFINETIEKLLSKFPNILVINDGSSDNTLDIILSKGVNVISHQLNCGQGAALETGFLYFVGFTNYKYIATFDADGQHNVSDLESMVKLIKKNNLSAVIGTRFADKKSIKKIPFLKRLTLRLAILFERIFYSIKNTDAHNGLRVISRRVVADYLLPISNYDMSHATEISFKLGKNVSNTVEFPVVINYSNIKSQSILNSINIVFKVIFSSFR